MLFCGLYGAASNTTIIVTYPSHSAPAPTSVSSFSTCVCCIIYCSDPTMSYLHNIFIFPYPLKIWELTLNLLTWSIWWAPNNGSKGQMGFNLAFEGLMAVRLKTKQICFCEQLSRHCMSMFNLLYSYMLVSIRLSVNCKYTWFWPRLTEKMLDYTSLQLQNMPI